ncbi:MAG: DUF1801 domain-containing protein [Ignavibacteriales bacterium]|nr:DUF1801 domain-containing protein [Ignavibacteriales bacterium]
MGKLAVIKTKENDSSVEDFISSLKDEAKQKDSLTILKLMQKATKEKPKMWGSSMIGFGKKIYKSPATDREVEWFKIGFSPRKSNFSLNLVLDIKKYETELKKLGKHKTGVGCLYINKLDDIDIKVLEKLITVAAKLK